MNRTFERVETLDELVLTSVLMLASALMLTSVLMLASALMLTSALTPWRGR
jgi:heme O synthase-like polyprenyltransferase